MSEDSKKKTDAEEQSAPEEGQETPRYSSTGRLMKPGMGLEGDVVQPKTVKKLITRFAVLMAILAVLFFGLRWILTNGGDLGGIGSIDSHGMISALQYHEHGAQAVVLKPDGTIWESSEYEKDAADQQPVWSPDGNFLYFVSNREVKGIKKGANNIFRWNLGKDMIQPRTTGSRSKGTPVFDPTNVVDGEAQALIVSGQAVLAFSPKDGSMHQILPPIGREVVVADSSSGDSTNAFEQVYSKFGASFKKAILSNDGKSVVAVMRREDGEILISQNLAGNGLPVLIMGGQYIDVEKNPVTGEFYALVEEFYIPFKEQIPPDFIKDGRVTYPFRHVLQRFTLGDDGKPTNIGFLMQSKSDDFMFKTITPSPDGQWLLVTAGKYEGPGNIKVNMMGLTPIAEAAGTQQLLVLNGEVFDPAWSPDSQKITYVKFVDGKRDIFTINKDGSNETNITGGKGDFGSPRFSPQESGKG